MPFYHTLSSMDLSDVWKSDKKLEATFEETYPSEDWEDGLKAMFSDWARPHLCPNGTAEMAQPSKKRKKLPEYEFAYREDGLPILKKFENGRPMTAARMGQVLHSFLAIHWCECLSSCMKTLHVLVAY